MYFIWILRVLKEFQFNLAYQLTLIAKCQQQNLLKEKNQTMTSRMRMHANADESEVEKDYVEIHFSRIFNHFNTPVKEIYNLEGSA